MPPTVQSAKCSVFSGKVAFKDKLGADTSSKQQPGSATQRRMCALRLPVIISISISIALTTEYAQSTKLTCSHGEADEAEVVKKMSSGDKRGAEASIRLTHTHT